MQTGHNDPPAEEDLKFHIEAANPDMSITKSDAHILSIQTAELLQHNFSIGDAGPGKDVVVSVASGSPSYPCVFYGIVAAGCVFSGANTAFQTDELVREIRDADAKMLMSSSEHVERTKKAAKRCHIPFDRVPVIDWQLRAEEMDSLLWTRSGSRPTNKRRTFRDSIGLASPCERTLNKQGPVSSGTTGLRKGVLLSRCNLVASNVCTVSVANAYRTRCKSEGHSTIAHSPMAHIAGIDKASTNPFYTGGTTY